MTAKKTILILAAIIILGAFLRFYNLGKKIFEGDEFFDVNAIYGYHMTGNWQAWDFNFGAPENDSSLTDEIKTLRNERSWIYRWQVAQLLKIFPFNEAVARSASAMWGIISIAIIYFIAKYFTKKTEIGLISAFLLAINISAITLSRTLRMYSMFFAVFLLFVWFLYRFLEEKYSGKIGFIKNVQEKFGINFLWFLPALACGAISFHLQPLALSIFPALGVYLMVQFARDYRQRKSIFNKYFMLLSVAIVASGLIWMKFFNAIGGYLAGLEISNDNLPEHLKNLALNYGYLPFTFLVIVFGIYFLFKFEKNISRKEMVWMTSVYFAILFQAFFAWNAGPFDRYIFFIRSMEIILVGTGIYYFASFIGNNFRTANRTVFYVSVVLLIALIPNYGYFFQESNPYMLIASKDELDYRSVFSHIKTTAKENDVLITRNYRSYYFSGLGMKVFNFGGELNSENKMLRNSELNNIVADNPSGWIVLSTKDKNFIKKGTQEYIEENFIPVENKKIKGSGAVYRWDNH